MLNSLVSTARAALRNTGPQTPHRALGCASKPRSRITDRHTRAQCLWRSPKHAAPSSRNAGPPRTEAQRHDRRITLFLSMEFLMGRAFAQYRVGAGRRGGVACLGGQGGAG